MLGSVTLCVDRTLACFGYFFRGGCGAAFAQCVNSVDLGPKRLAAYGLVSRALYCLGIHLIVIIRGACLAIRNDYAKDNEPDHIEKEGTFVPSPHCYAVTVVVGPQSRITA